TREQKPRDWTLSRSHACTSPVHKPCRRALSNYDDGMTADDRSSDAAVDIVPYDPTWPLLFERERAMLQRVLSPWLIGPIEHVGSTAVPGLAAKPVIDIMAGIENLEASR